MKKIFILYVYQNNYLFSLPFKTVEKLRIFASKYNNSTQCLYK